MVRTSILVAPGGATVRAAAEPTACLDAVASTTTRTPAPAQSPGSASPQPMDCDDNHPGPDDDAPGLHSTPVTKTCCRGPCTHDCDPQASDCDVSSQTWCTRKNLCVPLNWQFKHATRILDVIMLDYPVQVRPMPDMWVQSVPVTAIPWGRMKTEQRNLVIRSIR